MASIFTKIINGDIPSYKIYEDEKCYAFLDVFPLAHGHTLVVPKEEIDYVFDLPDDLLAHLHTVSKKVAHAIGKAFPCEKVGMSVIGLEVPHAHIHLIPMNQVSDMDFSRPKLELTKEEFEEAQKRIVEQLT